MTWHFTFLGIGAALVEGRNETTWLIRGLLHQVVEIALQILKLRIVLRQVVVGGHTLVCMRLMHLFSDWLNWLCFLSDDLCGVSA